MCLREFWYDKNAKYHKQSFRKPDVKQDLTATEENSINKNKKRKTKASCVLYYGDSCVHTQFLFQRLYNKLILISIAPTTAFSVSCRGSIVIVN